MNKGQLPGLNRDGWRRYEPLFLCAADGAVTHPTMDTQHQYQNGNPFGRYLITDKATVLVEVQMNFTGDFTIGAGSAYVFSLPIPALRLTGPGTVCPVPLGLAMPYFSFVDPQVLQPCVITLANPFSSLAGQEDNYVQAYCQNILSWGSGALASGVATVTHRCGYTPRAEDIEVVFTDSTLVGPADGPPMILNITSTTFDVSGRVLVAGRNAGFSWKVRGKPPTGQTGALMSPAAPWDWSRAQTFGPFGNIFLQCEYEPRR